MEKWLMTSFLHLKNLVSWFVTRLNAKPWSTNRHHYRSALVVRYFIVSLIIPKRFLIVMFKVTVWSKYLKFIMLLTVEIFLKKKTAPTLQWNTIVSFIISWGTTSMNNEDIYVFEPFYTQLYLTFLMPIAIKLWQMLRNVRKSTSQRISSKHK